METYSFSEPGSYTSTSTDHLGQIVTTTVPKVAASGSISRLSYQTPDFYRKMETGQLPENKFSYLETVTRNSHGVQDTFTRYSATRWTRSHSEGVFGTPSILDPMSPVEKLGFTENQRNLVLSRVLQAIKSSDIDLSVLTGEIRETAQMYLGFAKTLNSAVTAVKKGDILKLRSLFHLRKGLKKSSNMWLLFNFGIMPQAKDLLGACKALEKGLMQERYIVVQKRNTIREVKIISRPYYSGTDRQTWSYQLDTGVRVKYYVNDPLAATLTSLGLTNPLNACWQLARLSFVIDWAVGIGNWLSNLDASFGKTYVSGSYTQFWRTTMSGYYRAEPVKTPTSEFSETRDYGFSQVDCKREPIVTGFPIQYLPVLKSPFGLFQAITSAALLLQRHK